MCFGKPEGKLKTKKHPKEYQAALNDMAEVLHSVCDTRAEAGIYLTQLDKMFLDGFSEEKVYKELKRITERVYENYTK